VLLPPGAWPSLYAIVDTEACARADRAPLEVARAFLEAGVRLLQVRAKDLEAGPLLALTRAVVSEAAGRAAVVVNDRADVATLAGAAGVHVGQDDLTVPDARRVVGPAAIVGLSTHSVAQAAAALAQPLSYLAIGPVYPTGSKTTGYAALGLDVVREVAALTRPRGLPLVAIGGITLERAPLVLAAGASSVCVISDLLRGDPGACARRFLAVC
jgi:thiamine-phosphate pyrophosphorylase